LAGGVSAQIGLKSFDYRKNELILGIKHVIATNTYAYIHIFRFGKKKKILTQLMHCTGLYYNIQ